MSEPLSITPETDETLISKLRGSHGPEIRADLERALHVLQMKLQALEQKGIPPEQAKPLSAALLAVKSARGTLQSIKVGPI
jgi:hypothetical protein